MDLRWYLDQMGIRYHWSHHDTAYTAQDMARKEDVSGKKVVKPVLVEADGQFVLCALPASHFIDMEELRRELNAREARLADEPQIAQLFADCELGAEPPVGRLFGIATVMDDSLARQDEVIFQAGTHQDAVRMSIQDYLRLAQPRIAHFGRPRA